MRHTLAKNGIATLFLKRIATLMDETEHVRPFQVFSVFRITLACQNLTGRQGIKKKTEKKGRNYKEPP